MYGVRPSSTYSNAGHVGGQLRRLGHVGHELGAPARRGEATSGEPSTAIVPPCSTSPATARRIDDLPAPFGPIRHSHSPGATRRGERRTPQPALGRSAPTRRCSDERAHRHRLTRPTLAAQHDDEERRTDERGDHADRQSRRALREHAPEDVGEDQERGAEQRSTAAAAGGSDAAGDQPDDVRDDDARRTRSARSRATAAAVPSDAATTTTSRTRPTCTPSGAGLVVADARARRAAGGGAAARRRLTTM